ncbi:MAG: lipoprotein [Gammaproteobacteria bacterium]|nr:lipoprotein [Gammaproteobacteria bacterium]MBT6667738.1 lipoprotein [Gammaproteobacteria bacterium]MBT7173294.1 lipoprotein [Gammaproteobacteria bacterium]
MRIATLIIVLVLLPACGQKAPLYLPQDKAPEVSSRVQAGNDLKVANNSNQPLTHQEK